MTKRRLLLVGIDGLRVADALGGVDAPTLQALVSAGSSVPLVMEVPTISGPGWTSLLTGTTHAEHGVFDNSFVGHRIAPQSDLLSAVRVQQPSATTFAASGWPPLTDPDGPGPVIDPRRDDQHAGVHRSVVRDGETYGYRRADAEITAVAVHVLRDAVPDASFVYLGETDEAAHLYGAISDEYRYALARVDAHLAQLVSTIRSRTTDRDEEWILAVTTDHGHLDEGGHGGSEDIVRSSFLAAVTVVSGDFHPIPLPEVVGPHQVAPLLIRELL